MSQQITATMPSTGQFSALYLVQGASAAYAGAALVPQPAQPRNSRVFAPGTLWKLSDRTKKIVDPTLMPPQILVKNNGTLVQPYQYQHLGAGDIYFNSVPTVGGSPVAEVQTLTVGGTPTSAVIPLAFGNVKTTLAWTSATTNAQVAAALQALPTIGATGCTVAGAAGGPYTITFAGPLAAGKQPLIDTTGATFVGGTAPSATVVETTAGTAALTLDASSLSTSGAFDLFQLSEVVDYKQSRASEKVKSNVYGLVAAREYPSFIGTSLSFTGNTVDNILWSYQQTADICTLAAMENTKSTTPRIWILSGFFTQTEDDAPGGGMVGGQRMFSTTQVPFFINETL